MGGRLTLDDVREIAWRVLAGAAAGAVAGALVGGVGGRLAMLLLRLTSPDHVVGVTSDDGFAIGQVTLDTFGLVGAMAMVGCVNGVLYALLRSALPERWRAGLWGLFCAAAGGAAIVHEDGVDFTLLEPLWLAVALFVALPGVAGVCAAALCERWTRLPAWSSRRTATLLVVAAAGGTFGVVVAPVAFALLLVARAIRPPALRRLAAVAVPVLLVAVTAERAAELASTASRIL